jgi:hypothetical protein
MNVRVGKLVTVTVIVGILLCVGAVAVKAQVVLPCIHRLHSFDVVAGPFGPISVPCGHVMHPYGDIW